MIFVYIANITGSLRTLAKVSKLLVVIERGPHTYKGKSLKQIFADGPGTHLVICDRFL